MGVLPYDIYYVILSDNTACLLGFDNPFSSPHYSRLLCNGKCIHHLNVLLSVNFIREETEIIEGEVVELQIDRPATGTVSI